MVMLSLASLAASRGDSRTGDIRAAEINVSQVGQRFQVGEPGICDLVPTQANAACALQ